MKSVFYGSLKVTFYLNLTELAFAVNMSEISIKRVRQMGRLFIMEDSALKFNEYLVFMMCFKGILA